MSVGQSRKEVYLFGECEGVGIKEWVNSGHEIIISNYMLVNRKVGWWVDEKGGSRRTMGR